MIPPKLIFIIAQRNVCLSVLQSDSPVLSALFFSFPVKMFRCSSQLQRQKVHAGTASEYMKHSMMRERNIRLSIRLRE